MSQVGAFPNMRQMQRRAVRGPVNPLDKSTLVSIYPKPIYVENITLTPGKWNIQAGTKDKPSLLVISPSSWFKDVDPNEPLIEIPVPSVQVANSIVQDYCNGIFGASGGAQPGIFFVPGEHTIESINKNYPSLIGNSYEKQLIYYRSLIKWGDSLWARANGNPLAIGDDMRLAAKELGIADQLDWMRDHQIASSIRCKACGTYKTGDFPVCASCGAIDESHPNAKGLKFVQR